jgi:deoxyribonucleoside regulator
VSTLTRATRGRFRAPEEPDLLANIAEDYYITGVNQDAIATRYGISRSYVSRLLRRAREIGVVEIRVHREVRRVRELEVALEERFNVDRCLVVEDSPVDRTGAIRRAGQLAAGVLAEILDPDSVLALAWGNGVRAAVVALPVGRVSAGRVVQMFGGLSAGPAEIMSGELVTEAARLLNADANRLHAPWIVESTELARSLLEQPDVAAVLERAAGADVAVVGVGARGRESSALLFNDRYLSKAEVAEIDEAGAVGDICGRLFDSEGRACRVSIMGRVIGLELDTIRQVPEVIAIATGRDKAKAIRAALHGGLIRVLVTDADAARAILHDEPA